MSENDINTMPESEGLRVTKRGWLRMAALAGGGAFLPSRTTASTVDSVSVTQERSPNWQDDGDEVAFTVTPEVTDRTSGYRCAIHDPMNGPIAPETLDDEADGGPDQWFTSEWSGTAEFSYAGEGYAGDRSVRIDSEEGADGAWSVEVDVEANTDYVLGGWIKTENVEEGTGFGAQFNVHELGQDSLTDSVTGTEDWTYVEQEVNTGDNETLQVNCLLGGWGESTGAAWFDKVEFRPADAPENLLENPTIQDGDAGAYTTETWGGSAEFSVGDEGFVGDHSLRIDSEEGADAAWRQTVEVESDTDYVVSGWIKTEDFEVIDGFGAQVNISELGQDSIGGPVTGDTDWTYVEGRGNSGDAGELTINCLLGGWGTAAGTAWWDNLRLAPDANVVPNHTFQLGSPDIGDEVTVHLTNVGSEAWEVSEVEGASYEFISETGQNPEITLYEGVKYTFTDLPGDAHPLEFVAEDGTRLLSQDTTGVLEVENPPEFVVSTLDPTDVTLTRGEVVEVSATVENVGGAAANQTVSWVLAGDEVLGEENVELDAGESTTVTFELDTSEKSPGSWVHAVLTDDDTETGQLTIESTDSGEGTDDKTAEGGTETSTDAGGTEATADEGSTETTDDVQGENAIDETEEASQPGFGIVTTIAGLGASIAALKWADTDDET